MFERSPCARSLFMWEQWGADSLGFWFHPCGLEQEAASMLGNEVTGQSVNTHGSLWPWPGEARLSRCSENGNVNKIYLLAFWPLCGSIGRGWLLTAGEGFGEKSTQNLAAHKQTAKLCINVIQWSSKAEKQGKGAWNSQLASCVVIEVGTRAGESDLTSVWLTFLRKPLTVRVGLWPDQSLLF